MAQFPLQGIIKRMAEKRLQDKPSMGRNQWMFMKSFDGKRVSEFFSAAEQATANSPPQTFQGGAWWERELAWNLERGNIVIVKSPTDDPAPPTNPTYRAQRSEISSGAGDPGLYVVTLKNLKPISANAHDPRHVDSSIKVNRDNCKFGKAQSLSARRENYVTTFGAENVHFVPIASIATPHLARAERIVADSLTAYRLRGPSGRLTEWMAGIGVGEVIEQAFQKLNSYGIPHRDLR